MFITLIILVFVLATAGFIFTVKRYNRALPENRPNALQRPESVLLFTPNVEAEKRVDNRRTNLAERAARGETAALADAHATGDRKVYDEVLNALIDARMRQ